MASSFPDVTKTQEEREEKRISLVKLKQRRGPEDEKQQHEEWVRDTEKKEKLCRERKKRDRETKTEKAETPGTDRQGCGERSLISQHHLLPVPGLKAPLMSNLPQPHTSRAPQSCERTYCLFRDCPLHLFLLHTYSLTHSHPLQWHKHTL